MTKSKTNQLVAYGDSQTAGFSWGNRLVQLSGGRISRAVNRGASGQSSGTVGIRQGGIRLVTTAEAVLGTDEASPVAFRTSVAPCNQRTPSIPGLLAGVRGVFVVVSPGSNTGEPSGTFKPDAPLSSPVQVPVGTEFIPEDVADHPEYGEYLHTIWAGGNDRAFNGSNAAPGTVLAAKAQVERLRQFVDEPLFLVAGPTVYSGEVEGTSGHTRAIEARDQLQAEFPDNFINIWEHVRDNGLQILGIEPTEADRTALAGKSMPPSLTSDNIHFSTATREGVIAPFILEALDSRGWLTTQGVDPEMPDYELLNKKTGDTWDEAACATIDRNTQAMGEEIAKKATSESVENLGRDLESKVNDDAMRTELDKKLNNSGTKVLEGTTTFNGISSFTNSTSFASGVRFGGQLQSANVVAEETTPMFTRFNATTGAKSFTLKSGVAGGRRYVVGNWQGSPVANTVTLVPPSGVTINGSPDPITIKPGELIEVISTGSGGAWHIVSRYNEEVVAATGTRAHLDAGTDTVIRGFSAKDISEFVNARIQAAMNPNP